MGLGHGTAMDKHKLVMGMGVGEGVSPCQRIARDRRTGGPSPPSGLEIGFWGGNVPISRWDVPILVTTACLRRWERETQQNEAGGAEWGVPHHRSQTDEGESK